ncbi:MAG TPA: hypothetical protein VIY08_11790 [Candidatus Nitrosocosmicus sp.]
MSKFKQYLIQPYSVGKDKKSLAMVLPSGIVKSLRINPMAAFLLLQVKGADNIELKIIREEDLIKKETESMMPVEKFTRLAQQESLIDEVE